MCKISTVHPPTRPSPVGTQRADVQGELSQRREQLEIRLEGTSAVGSLNPARRNQVDRARAPATPPETSPATECPLQSDHSASESDSDDSSSEDDDVFRDA